MYSGALLPYSDDVPPRLRIVRLPSAVRLITTRVDRDARYSRMDTLCAACPQAPMAVTRASGAPWRRRGQFTMKPLPVEMQLAPLNAVVAAD